MILLDASIRVAVLAVVVLLILRLARVRSSRVEYAAWTMVLVAMLTMPVLTWLMPLAPGRSESGRRWVPGAATSCSSS